MTANPQKKLVIFSSLFFLLLSSCVFFWNRSHLPEGILINTKGQPTVGHPKAQVHLVLFEEPKCVSCKEYNTTIFPKIKEAYIDTHKVQYTVILVSFLPHSMPAAEALFSVYYSDPLYPNDDLFFTYLDYMYSHQPPESTDWATSNQLIEFAKEASPAINLTRMRTCIEKEIHRTKIEKNTAYGKQLMGGTITTPTLYVNGIKVESLTYDDVKKLIDEVLSNHGLSKENK